MNKVQPTVSIGMPIYNGQRYLREALDSLLEQDYSDFELILSDNASTDKTREICEEFAARDKRVRYYRQSSNCGVFANTEFLINSAVGRYYMLVGDDDVYVRSFISTLVPILDRDESIGLAFSGFGYIRPDGTRVAGNCNLNLTPEHSRFQGLVKFMFRRSALPMMLGLFRREVLLKALPFPAAALAPMTGDVDNVFLVGVLSACKSVNVDERLCFYRLKDRSGGLPTDWPPSVGGQIRYIFGHHRKVVSLMQDVLKESNFTLPQKTLLMTANWISMVWLFFQYVASRFLNNG